MAIKFNDENEDDIIAEINMTPLIDIMLVLLIIFMVTSSITIESGVEIDLPKSKQESVASKRDQVVIVSFDKGGKITVQGQLVSLETFKDVLKGVLDKTENKTVVFEGDQNASLGATIKIMDMAKEVGATQFSIATDNTK